MLIWCWCYVHCHLLANNIRFLTLQPMQVLKRSRTQFGETNYSKAIVGQSWIRYQHGHLSRVVIYDVWKHQQATENPLYFCSGYLCHCLIVHHSYWSLTFCLLEISKLNVGCYACFVNQIHPVYTVFTIITEHCHYINIRILNTFSNMFILNFTTVIH